MHHSMLYYKHSTRFGHSCDHPKGDALQRMDISRQYTSFFLFTNECTSDCLKSNIKIYIKIAPTCFGAEHTIFRERNVRAC